ncbi:MAG: lipoyl(octanoyl) transferase LipB [Acidobacteria bacterium]|nr:lipoyl(octanoyl) transferase LipB [Acidobacteriota bacterium]
MRVCRYCYLGLTNYAAAHTLQEQIHERRKNNDLPDMLLLLEHRHVITLGRAANRANVLVDETRRKELGVELFETGRGGDVTYHGPGQLVGYPIIKLAPDRCDVRRYVRDLEEVLIRTAGDFGIEAGRIDGLTGIWVGDEKLAAIGVRIARWVSMHGFALNVSTDLDYFNLIVPCGIRDHSVTSLGKLLRAPLEMQSVVSSVTRHFGEVFQRQMFIATAIDHHEKILALPHDADLSGSGARDHRRSDHSSKF